MFWSAPHLVRTLAGCEISFRLEGIPTRLDEQGLTFGIAGVVAQCLQALGAVLPRWLGEDWRALLNGALQGQAAVISAQQIVRLAEIADMVRRDPSAMSLFTGEGWDPGEVRRKLEGTEVVRAFTRYLDAYDHRALGESDVMSLRFAARPG